MADANHPITGAPLHEIELKTIQCAICARLVEVAPHVDVVRCLEHAPEYWEGRP